MIAKGEGFGEEMDWEVGVSRCELLYIEWINNKVLLYSTENYIQYPVINDNGKEYFKKECVYIYIELNHCAIYLKLTQYYKSTIIQFKKMYNRGYGWMKRIIDMEDRTGKVILKS